jgi:catechol 2,3-dioxygenase-like lactoylglutathione lyase family enzyme
MLSGAGGEGAEIAHFFDSPACRHSSPDRTLHWQTPFLSQRKRDTPPPRRSKKGAMHMTIKRMDNVLIVVDDLEAVKAFFIKLGLELEGQTTVEGPSIGRLIGLGDVRATLAMLRTPDGQGIELDKFHTPNAVRFGPVDAPVNTLGLRRIMFAVDDIDAVVARMQAHGAELIGQMQYEQSYRLAYIRGPEGIIVGLAEQLG